MTEEEKLDLQTTVAKYLETGNISDDLPKAALSLAQDYLSNQKDFDQSMQLYDIAIKTASELYGEESGDTLLLKNNFGVSLNNSNKYETSEPIFEEVLSLREKLYPEDITNIVVTRVNLAFAKLNQKKYDGLVKEYESILKLNKDELGNEVYERIILGQLSDLLYNIKQYDNAYKVGKKYHLLCVKEQDKDSWKTALAEVRLGDICYYFSEKHAEGIYFYNEALKTLNTHFPEYKYKIMCVKYSLAMFYFEVLNDNSSAYEYFSQVINEYPTNTNKNDYHYRISLIYLADILISENKSLDEANNYLNEALQLIKESKQSLVASLSDVFYSYSRLFILQKENEKAVQAIEYAIKTIVEKRGVDDWRSQKFMKHLNKIDPSNPLLSKLNGSKDAVAKNDYSDFVIKELYSKANKRSIRVFISSTFKDMMNEREYLMKNTFPQFKRMCKEKGVEFTEVDLRWGVTEEDALKGKVIEICLNEIDKSRPYFIGILGERYGWIPDYNEYSKYNEIFENYSWVKNDLKEQLSITEMEIQYGVLRNPKMNNHAFFYLRDERLTPDGHLNREKKNSKEYKKLKELKKYLSSQNNYPVQNFLSIEELGEQILNDLINNVLSQYKDAQLKRHEKYRLQQISYLKNFITGFVGRNSFIKKIDEFINGKEQQLVLSGEGGIGKTAIIANWLYKNIRKNKDTFYLFHFAEGNAESTDYHFVLSRILNELKLEFNIDRTIRDNSPTPSEDFNNFLAATDPNRNVVIVIDGIDKIIHHNFFAKLHWLPSIIPNNVKIIVTSRKGEIFPILSNLGYAELEIKWLKKISRSKFIKDYLNTFGKSLPKNLSEKIVEDDVSVSPLTLRVLLDELRIFGVHEKLEDQLNRYLIRNGAIELFDEVLKRIEEDYGMDNPKIIGETLALISLSKSGLSENELVEMTQIPKMQWSPIYSALETYFINNAGQINILNDSLNEAILKRYVSKRRKKSLHKKLVRFFKEIDSSERKYAELGFHLYNADDKEGLKDYLCDLNIFKLYSRDNVNEFFKYWENIREDYSFVDEYLESFNKAETNSEFNPIELAELAIRLAQYVAQYYKPEVEFYFLDKAYRIYNEHLGENNPRVIEIINRLGGYFLRRKEHDRAKKYLKTVIKWIDNNPKLVNFQKLSAYLDLADLEISTQNYKQAEKYVVKAIKYGEQIAGKDSLGIIPSLMKLAEIYKSKEDFIKSFETLQKALQINNRYAGEENLATGLNYQALADLCFETENYTEARKFAIQALEIFNKTTGENSLYTMHTLHVYGMTEYFLENYDIAVELIIKALTIAFDILEEDQGILVKRDMANYLEKIGEIENDVELIELAKDVYTRLDESNGEK